MAGRWRCHCYDSASVAGITTEFMNHIIAQATSAAAACLIVLLNSNHIYGISDETIVYADSLDFPVFAPRGIPNLFY